MGMVLQFAEQLAGSEEWSPGERAQLREIGSQLAAEVADADVVFGATEQGDPWCVVVDASGEVLLHIARIEGTFVVHSSNDNRSEEGPELWATAARLLGEALRDRRGVVLPFGSENGWATPVALAFVLSFLLRDEYAHLMPETLAPLRGRPGLDEAPASADDSGGGAGQAGSQGDGGPQASEALRDASAAPAERPHTPHAVLPPRQGGGEGQAASQAGGEAPPQPAKGAEAQPAAAAGRIQGGDGQAQPPSRPQEQGGATVTTGESFGTTGAGGGAQSRLTQGGEGADRVALGSGHVAEGKGGADLFVAASPALDGFGAALVGGRQPVLAGVIADFNEAEGDRIEFTGAPTARLVGVEAVADILAPFRTTGGSDLPAVVGRRLSYDLDGDGRADAYVLAADTPGAWLDSFGRGAGLDPAGLVSSPPARPSADASTPGGAVESIPAAAMSVEPFLA